MTELTIIPASGAALPAVPFTARHLIDGAWVDSADGATSERQSPAHGVTVSIAAKGGQAETETAIAAARRVFDAGDWSRASGKDRATILLKVADLIERDIERIALIETLGIGQADQPGARGDRRRGGPLALCRGAGPHDAWRQPQLAWVPTCSGLVLKEPIGVAGIICPWNFPFLIVSQKLPFALAAGCTAVVKPSELTPSSTVILGELLQEAGLPKGVVNIVLGFGDPVGAMLSTHPSVDMVSFTGSTAVGQRIVAAASGTLKKVSLELGGKNPQVIFPDADLDQAADAITFGVYFNAGECCNSGSRIIVHEDVADALVAKVVELSRKVPFGDPLDPRTQVGAIISPEHMGKIDGYVKGAAEAGAGVALGGAPISVAGLAGQFYGPTIVTGVRPDMPIATEEVFGPVLSVLSFRNAEEAIALANAASYGLSAGVWSRDMSTCLDFARRVHAGTVWTNTWMDGFAELPFGGVKQSGQGRELGRYGLEEFLEAKTVQMRIGDTRAPWVAT
jgi:betaine-aldehyde dehydrogenase